LTGKQNRFAADEWRTIPASPPAHGHDLDVRDFRSVYEAWADDVARWVRALGGPRSDQDDLVQEVFVIVHRRLHHFDGQNLPGWLYRITSHQVRDFRRLRWFKNMILRGAPLTNGIASPEPTALTMLETREKQELLDRLLSRLSAAQRVTFILFEIDGYSGEEIAQLHRVSLNTVRARIHRARKKLTAALRDERGDGVAP
jgi:RNA polymerase sigma-70 factor (ECF subfamily)